MPLARWEPRLVQAACLPAPSYSADSYWSSPVGCPRGGAGFLSPWLHHCCSPATTAQGFHPTQSFHWRPGREERLTAYHPTWEFQKPADSTPGWEVSFQSDCSSYLLVLGAMLSANSEELLPWAAACCQMPQTAVRHKHCLARSTPRHEQEVYSIPHSKHQNLSYLKGIIQVRKTNLCLHWKSHFRHSQLNTFQNKWRGGTRKEREVLICLCLNQSSC